MNLFSRLLVKLTSEIPKDTDCTAGSRERNIVMRLSKGNVRLQQGMYETEVDVAHRKARILEHNFI